MNKEQFDFITQWQKETFGKATAESKVHHLKQEVDELLEALKNKYQSVRLEFADCFLLLFGAAAAAGMTYEDCCLCVNEKMKINLNRTWGQPDENGVVNHIPERIISQRKPAEQANYSRLGDVSQLDELFPQAAVLVVKEKRGGVQMLQRRFNIDLERATKLVEQLEEKRILGPFKGSEQREVFIMNVSTIEKELLIAYSQ